MLLFGFIGLLLFICTLNIQGATTHPTPWCGAAHGPYLCHKFKGHKGEHWCDDPSGEFRWSTDT